MWSDRAVKVTPGGAQTLSKRKTAFPSNYPTHIDYGSGAYLTDVRGIRYLDFIGGLGAVSLGYAHSGVNGLVSRQLQRGVSFSLSHWIEVETAERLVELIPCAEQVRFVKTGSEACAGVVRVARMATGRETILAMGYHGWHDWYASTKTFAPGVPAVYSVYNRPAPRHSIEELRKVFERDSTIAAVILEPALNETDCTREQRSTFLQQVVDTCHEFGALCIFDEMLCGFRWARAGGQEFFGVTPDLAVFGKGMANGFPLACIVGPRHYMENAWPVSGTFGGEALSLMACSATLSVYESEPVISHLWELGTMFMNDFNALAKGMGAGASCIGWPVHPIITFDYDVDKRLLTLFHQELCERGILMHPQGNNIVYAMTRQDIEQTLMSIEEVFNVIVTAQREGKVTDLLKGPAIGEHPLGRMPTS